MESVTIDLVVACAAVASISVGIALWAVMTFQTKKEAEKFETGITKWIQRLEDEVGQTRAGVENIRSDVQYIRGRLEPRN